MLIKINIFIFNVMKQIINLVSKKIFPSLLDPTVRSRTVPSVTEEAYILNKCTCTHTHIYNEKLV
jgi:hypothetical protein